MKTIYGIEIFKKLLDVFQGDEHEEDKSFSSASLFERLKFNKNIRYSPEKFLDKVNEYLKRVEVEDRLESITLPVINALFPSIFRAKIDHSTCNTYKELSEINK